MSPENSPGDYPLDPALDFLQRLWRLNHALEKLSSEMERRLGVTAQQRLMVRCIGKFPGMTAGRLASLLHVDPGTVSAALNRLEEKKLLVRRRDPRDKRRVSLGLTAKGRKVDASSRGTVESAVARWLEESPTRERKLVARMLERLAVHVSDEAATLYEEFASFDKQDPTAG